jgi:magnesium transporter
MLFTGDNFMVTVQHGASEVLAPVRRRLEAMPDLLRHGPSAVLYGICDAVVDDYERIVEEVEEDLEKLETKVFASEGGADSARIYALKRHVLEFRHAVVPLGHPMRVLTGSGLEGIDPITEPYFRDVADHLARVAEKVETFDALLTDISPLTLRRSASSRTRRPANRMRTCAASRRGWPSLQRTPSSPASTA